MFDVGKNNFIRKTIILVRHKPSCTDETHSLALGAQVNNKMYVSTVRGSAIVFLTRDRGARGSSLTGVTVLVVQIRKTRPDITEKLLTGS